MTYTRGTGGHYSRSSFHNNNNYKYKKRKNQYYNSRKVTKTEIKQQRNEKINKVYHERKVEKSFDVLPDEQHDAKSIVAKLNTKVPSFDRLSMVLLESEVHLDSHVYVFSEEREDGQYPATMWVISPKELSIQDTWLSSLLKKHVPPTFLDMPELQPTMQRLKGRCTDLLRQHTTVGEDPQLIDVLHASGVLKRCSAKLLENQKEAGYFIVDLSSFH